MLAADADPADNLTVNSVLSLQLDPTIVASRQALQLAVSECHGIIWTTAPDGTTTLPGAFHRVRN